MRIVAIADTHTCEQELRTVPDGDVLIHAGDMLRRGTAEELVRFSAYEEFIELRRRRWAAPHLLFTPVGLVFSLLTAPKYIAGLIARISWWMGVAGAHPVGRWMIVMGLLFVANCWWFLNYVYVTQPKLLPAG
jgi:hypothetical protein